MGPRQRALFLFRLRALDVDRERVVVLAALEHDAGAVALVVGDHAAAAVAAGPGARDRRAEAGVEALHRLRRAADHAGTVVDRDRQTRRDRLGTAVADLGGDGGPG